MTAAFIAAVSAIFALACLPAAMAGYLLGLRRGYAVGHAAGWQAHRFAYDGDDATAVDR